MVEALARELDRFGLRPIVELALDGAAAGVVAVGYGRDAFRAQLRASATAWSALDAARLHLASVGVSRAGVFELIDLLLERLADRIIELMHLAGLTTTADLDLICARLDRIAARVATLERTRLPRAGGSAAEPPARLSLRPSAARGTSASSNDAGAVAGLEPDTVVIGSVPDAESLTPPRDRASAMSPAPDALSEHLARRTVGPSEDELVGRSTPRRGGTR